MGSSGTGWFASAAKSFGWKQRVPFDEGRGAVNAEAYVVATIDEAVGRTIDADADAWYVYEEPIEDTLYTNRWG